MPTPTQISPAVNSALGSFLLQIKQMLIANLDEATIASNINTLFSTGLDLFNNPTLDFEYGYNSVWMGLASGQSITLPKVNLGTLKRGVLATGTVNSTDGSSITTNWGYVPLGLILAYINNSCTLYTNKKPVIYLDFHPDTNYCQSLPQQFSIDPTVCLIDTQPSAGDLQALFSTKGITSTDLTTPLQDFSITPGPETSYLEHSSAYRGKIMNIMVNIDLAVNLIDQQIDSQGNITLSQYLLALLSKVKTALGGINDFKLSYNEASNTVRIVDAQYLSNGASSIPTLPVFGLKSIAREYSLKTEASTRIGSMLAISARAGARNYGQNQDATALAAINNNLIDRLLVGLSPTAGGRTEVEAFTAEENQRQAAANPFVIAPTAAQPISLIPQNQRQEFIRSQDQLVIAANQFNDQLNNMYYTFFNSTSGTATPLILNFNPDLIESTTNFYIDAMNILKNGDSTVKLENDGVTANGILPLALNLTIDGISTIPLFQTFAIPADRLPAQYVRNGSPEVVFTVAGINHAIQNNQWTTSIRAIMINIPKNAKVRTVNYTATTRQAKGPCDDVTKRSNYPIGKFPVVPYKQTSIPKASIIAYVKTIPYSKSVQRSVLASIAIETSWGRSGINNNINGMQTDGGRWMDAEKYIKGVTMIRENLNGVKGGGKCRSFAVYDTWQDCVDHVAAIMNSRTEGSNNREIVPKDPANAAFFGKGYAKNWITNTSQTSIDASTARYKDVIGLI